MRRLLIGLFHRFTSWLGKVEFFDGEPKITLANFDELNESLLKSTIVMYSIKNCSYCEEMKLWLDSNWIPYTLLEARPKIPTTVVKRRDMSRHTLYECRDRKKKKTYEIFLAMAFPQFELIQKDRKDSHPYSKKLSVARVIGNTKVLRAAIEHFVESNPQDFPGFEQGVYGDRQYTEPPKGEEK